MKDNGIVQGEAEQAKPYIVNFDNVYVHKNITEIESKDGHKLYEYQEYVYNKDEYIALLASQNEETLLALAELGQVVANG